MRLQDAGKSDTIELDEMDLQEMDLDEIDLKLLGALQEDGRQTYSELARAFSLPVSTVNDRVKRLVADSFVRDVVARIAPEKVGLAVCAFIQVVIDAPAKEAAFLREVGMLSAVQECHSVSGEFSYLLKVRVRGTSDLGEFLRDVVRKLPGVGQTNTMIALTTVKETTAVSLPDQTAHLQRYRRQGDHYRNRPER